MSRLVFNVRENHIEIALAAKYLNSVKMKKVFDFTPVEDNKANADMLKNLLKKYRISEKKLDVILSLDGIVTRQIEVPYMKQTDLSSFVKNNIGQYFTVNPEDFYFDYKIVELKKEIKKLFSIMLVAVPKEKLDNIKAFVKMTGLKLNKVGIYPEALTSFFRKYDDESIAVVDIGTNNTFITILDKGNIFVHSLLQLDINDEDSHGELLDNLSYFLNFYSSRHFGNKIDKVLIIGEKIEDNKLMNILIENIDGNLIFNLPEINGEEGKYTEILGNCITTRTIYNKHIDFKEAVNEKVVEKNNTIIISAAAIMIAALLGWVGYFYITTYSNNSEAEDRVVKAELERYSLVEKTIKNLNNENKVYQKKADCIKEIKSDEMDYIAIIDAFKKGLPKNITVKSLNITKNSVTVDLNVDDSTLDAARAVIAVNNMKRFEPVEISDIKLDDTVKEIVLNLKPKNPN